MPQFHTASFPRGFRASGCAAGVGYKRGKKDIAIFLAEEPAVGAAVFTHSVVKAAPVIITEDRLLRLRGRVRAVVVNSGSANAATGGAGHRDALDISVHTARALGCDPDEVWLSSTGVIGPRLKMAPFRRGVAALSERLLSADVREGGVAAEAIMTTDTRPKTAGVRFPIGGTEVRLWGCAKGAGMIHPDLRGPRGQLHATMIAVLVTDAAVGQRALQWALEKVTDRTFNCVSIDGDTSTNDFVGLLASGASGAPAISAPQGAYYRAFLAALHQVCDDLTTQIAMDGEGASKLVLINVQGARTEEAARRMAAVIGSSPLVKTACHGADPNWGRILAAMGRAGVRFDPDRVRIWIGDMLVCDRGQERRFSEKAAIAYMRNRRIVLRVDLGLGRRSAHFKTCDFTGQYVGINAGYRT